MADMDGGSVTKNILQVFQQVIFIYYLYLLLA